MLPGTRRWLERLLLVLSVAGLLLTRLAIARLGRRGGLIVEGVCLLLFARAAQFIASGAPRNLQTLPRRLAYVELAVDALAVTTGACAWRFPRGRGFRHLNQLALLGMFFIHSVRYAIYLSPRRGRRTPPQVGTPSFSDVTRLRDARNVLR